jgi:hypothetical protein
VNDQLLIAGFLVLAVLQVALLRRLRRVPEDAASSLNLTLLFRARESEQALKEGAAQSVREIVASLDRLHEKISRDQHQVEEVLRETLATQNDLTRERDHQLKHLVDLARALRDATRKTCLIERELAELVTARVPILRPPPVPHAALPEPEGDDGEGKA